LNIENHISLNQLLDNNNHNMGNYYDGSPIPAWVLPHV
jgi:hypothetical protein